MFTVDQILTYYLTESYKKDSLQQYPSLLGGRSGSVVILFLLYHITFDNRIRKLILKNLDEIITQCNRQATLSPGFSNGLAGIGWLFSFLNETELIHIDTAEFLSDVDTFLSTCLQELIANKQFALMNGVAGVGLYFLKRRQTDLLENIILSFEKNEIFNETGVCWIEDPVENAPLNAYKKYNLGLAHGHTGILYFLGKCWEANVLRENCTDLISKGIKFLLSHTQSFAAVGSFFPNAFIHTGSGATVTQKSRLAWCYGDLSILHTLLLLSQKIDTLNDIQKNLFTMIEKTLSRTDPKNNEVTTAYFCHGASGVGYIYQKIHALTANPQVACAIEHWFTICRQMAPSNMEKPAIQKAGMLEGVAGVSAFFLNHEYDNLRAFDWDECLFLS